MIVEPLVVLARSAHVCSRFRIVSHSERISYRSNSQWVSFHIGVSDSFAFGAAWEVVLTVAALVVFSEEFLVADAIPGVFFGLRIPI